MELTIKADIVESFVRDYLDYDSIDDSIVAKFLIFNNLGIPLAQAVAYDLATLTKEGEFILEETWKNLCDLLNIDPDGEYESLEDCLDFNGEDDE